MAKATATPPEPRTWVAKDVDELRAVWGELRLDSDDPKTERRFFGRAITAEEAGDAFERWVMEAFRLSGVPGDYAFTVPLSQSGNTREEIDGLILDGWQAFLVESKFWTGKVDFGPLAMLHTLLDSRPIGTMGLFFSAFGYTEPAKELARMTRPLRVLMFAKRDLLWALPPTNLKKQKAATFFEGRMRSMVRRKWVLTIRFTRPYADIDENLGLFNEKED